MTVTRQVASLSLSLSLALLLRGKKERDAGTPPPWSEALPCGRGSKSGRGNVAVLAVPLVGGKDCTRAPLTCTKEGFDVNTSG